MRSIISLEKILVHNKDMDYVNTQIRIKLFGYIIVGKQKI